VPASRFSIVVAAVVVAVAACGGAGPSPVPATPTLAAPSASASASVVPAQSGSPAASASGSASPASSDGSSIGLPHVDAALEDLLPGTIGNIPLEKFSEPLSTLVASSQGGEKVLYPAWLVPFAKTPDDVNVAIAVDFTNQENFHADAIQVPGASAATLSTGFADVARKAGWPVNTRSVAAKSVLEITDPTAPAGVLAVGYVYASGDVLYIIVTDDASLLVEALIKLP
jgi:hypothetical protein